MINVTAARIRSGNRFLICRRPMDKNCGGKWEFPGGKIEPGETGSEAITRECAEELRIRVSASREPVAEAEHDYGSFSIHLSLYDCEIIAGSVELAEHSACEWITEEEIDRFDFCPADQKLIAQLYSR